MTTSLPSNRSALTRRDPTRSGPGAHDDPGPCDDLGAGPPVVLLHPPGFGPEVLDPFARNLARHRRVVVPHRRGFGTGAGLPLPATLDVLHDDLARLIGALGLDRPLLAGVSGGATLALGFALRHPDLVGATVAHEPLAGPPGGPVQARLAGRVARLLERADQPHETALFISELVGVGTWNTLRQDWRLNVERYGAATRNEVALIADDVLDDAALATLARRPVLVTVGERSPAPRHDLSATLAERGVATRVIAGAAHLPSFEAPAELSALLDDIRPAAA